MKSHGSVLDICYSIIIPAYNAEETLGACLEALDRQSIPKENYEIIVVDDGSTDGTSQTAKRHNIKYIFQANKGPATARNKGAQTAGSDIILFTDSDCIPDHHWIREMVSPFDDSGVVGVKGAYRTWQKSLAARFAQAEFEDRYDLLQKSVSIDMIDTYSASFRKKVFQDMGGFNESFPVPNNEDTEFSYRLAAARHKLVFNPNAIVYHTHPDTFIQYLKLKFWRGYWRMVVYRRYPDKAVKDSYTPSVIKIQTIFMAFSLPIFPLALFIPNAIILALFFWCTIIALTFPFSLKTFKKDKLVGIVSPGVILLRSMVFAFGSLLGMARGLCRTSPPAFKSQNSE